MSFFAASRSMPCCTAVKASSESTSAETSNMTCIIWVGNSQLNAHHHSRSLMCPRAKSRHSLDYDATSRGLQPPYKAMQPQGICIWILLFLSLIASKGFLLAHLGNSFSAVSYLMSWTCRHPITKTAGEHTWPLWLMSISCSLRLLVPSGYPEDMTFQCSLTC